MAHFFSRLHIPSGRVCEGEFNASHGPLFADPDWHAFHTLNNAKLALVNEWNRQQPTEWKYWI